MPLRVTCAACSKQFNVPDNLVGRKVQCPGCKAAVSAKAPAADPLQGSAGLPDLAPLGTSSPLDLGPLGGDPLGGGGGLGGGPLDLGALGASPLGMSPSLAGPQATTSNRGGATPAFLQWYAIVGYCVVAIGIVATAVFFLTRDKERPLAVAQQPAPRQSAPETVTESPPPAPPAAEAKFALLQVDDASLPAGGKATVGLKLERGKAAGPIAIQLEGLPGGVVNEPLEIAAGASTGSLELSAGLDAVGDNLPASVKIVATSGEQSAEGTFKLTLKPRPPIALSPLANLTLKPGDSVTIDVKFERNGHEGAVQISMADLPEKTAAEPVEVPPEAASAKLQLVVAADAKEGAKAVKVAAALEGQKVEAKFQLLIERFACRILPMPVLTLKPGEKRTLDLVLQRRSYKGPLTLTVTGLPDDVSAKPVEVPAGGLAAKLEIVAGDKAPDLVRTARVLCQGDKIERKEPLVVRISRGEGGFLPKDVATNPELAKLLRRGSFGGRLETASKKALLEVYGGNEESEEAVLKGLRFLARNQEPDGRWLLMKQPAPLAETPEAEATAGKAAEGIVAAVETPVAPPAEGSAATMTENETAATAFGLLPFLGAGITHKSAPDEPAELAKYKTVVKKGLEHLINAQIDVKDPKQSHKDGELPGGMYAHALGTIALCEAYGLSADEKLKIPAQRAIKYLVQGQNQTTGGWGYGSRSGPGDTSVVGWVFLAIRSGQLANLAIDRQALTKAGRFLNSTAAGPEGAKFSRYSYKPDEPARLSLSAAGLLTRQYLGWEKDHQDLAPGCAYLMENLPPENGPKLGAIYYYYYATQVLHHMEGENWDKWNFRMREHLLRTQAPSGAEEGSWSPDGVDHGARGGRLYATSLSLLTLEVYYRHLPMYRKAAKVETAASEKAK